MQDLRDAVRALRAAPIVSAAAILSLALGIGANTAIFSIVNGLLLRTLPVPAPERLVLVHDPGQDFSAWSYPVWEELKKHSSLFGGAIAYSTVRFNATHAGEADLVEGLYGSGEFFEVLGVPAILGRTFAPADDTRGGGPNGPVAVISYAYWQRRFGGAASAIGATISLNRVPFTVVGVTPPEFFGPVLGERFDVAVPFGTEPLIRRPSGLDERGFWWVEIMLRLKPGQAVDEAQTALRGVQPQVRAATMPHGGRPEDLAGHLKEPFALMSAGSGSASIRTQFQRPMLALLAVVALVLLIACANIANLMLARSTARRKELAMRAALGASRVRLARQLLSESALIAAIGALGGLLFARWVSEALVAQMSTPRQRLFLTVDLDARAIAFTTLAASAAAILFGIAPALRATRVRAHEALKEHGGLGPSDSHVGLAHGLVVVQIALSLVLVVGAGLFIGTFGRLATLDPGFDTQRVLVTRVDAQRSRTPLDTPSRAGHYDRLRLAAAAVPGVDAATASVITPVGGMMVRMPVRVPGAPELSEEERTVAGNLVSPDFFRTMGTRFVGGRDFSAHDQGGSPPVAIVNEAFARTFLKGPAIGRIVEQEGFPGRPATAREIVGLVEDAVYGDLRQEPPPTMYVPMAQAAEGPFLEGGVQISVRAAAGSPALLTRSVAAALTSVDPDLALTFRPLADEVRDSLAQERVIAVVSGFFGGLALLLAALGLYGLTAYAVSRRRSEIGIRMALGADAGAVLRMVLGRVILLVGAGVLAGGIVSFWAVRLVSSLLYGVQPRDPVTLGSAAVVLAATAGFAGWLPARRASRIDPAQVLREM